METTNQSWTNSSTLEDLVLDYLDELEMLVSYEITREELDTEKKEELLQCQEAILQSKKAAQYHYSLTRFK